MTKHCILIIFLLTNLISVMSLYHIRKSDHYLRKPIQYLMGTCCLMTVSYMICLISNQYMVSKITYYIYFVLMGWVCAAVLYYTYCFSADQKVPKKYNYFMLLVLAMDSLLQLLNIWFEVRMNDQTVHKKDNISIVFQKEIPFRLHIIICYLIVGIAIILLLYRIILCARIFRTQYMTLLMGLLLIMLGKGLLAFSSVAYDYAILGYNLASVLLCYYTLYYTGNQMMHRISGVALKSIPSMVLIFDCRGELIYKNYSIVSTLIHGKNEQDILRELAIDETQMNVPLVKEFENTKTGESRVCQVSFKQLFDENMLHQRKKVGSCLIIRDITEDREELNSSIFLVNHDSLTGLYNKKYFYESSQQLIIDHPSVEFAILMIDIYQFTQYNVCFGTKEGDLVLQKIAYKLLTRIHDPLVRYGHYEAGRFVICLPLEYCNEEFYKKNGLYDPIQTNRYQLGFYSGLCPISKEDKSLQIVCEHALAALGTIKGSSTKKIAVYNDEMRKQFLMEKRLVVDFPEAMKNGAIVGYIQPQINQLTKQIIGGEVLARWIDQDGSIISPAVFIPVLEKNNLISKLDYHIWEETCRFIKQTELNGTPIALSVNLSAQDFYHFDIYEVFVSLTDRYKISPEYLRLEITESDVINNISTQLPLIKKLQARGFLVEMDDFGSGFSSLNSLKDIPVSVLKMDMKFFEGAQSRGRSQIIVRNVIRMAKELELAIIAEGVETIDQAEFLKSAGCNLIQGYLYGRPIEASEFLKLYYENVKENRIIG